MRPGGWVAAAERPPVAAPLSHRGRAVIMKERDVVRDIEVTS